MFPNNFFWGILPVSLPVLISFYSYFTLCHFSSFLDTSTPFRLVSSPHPGMYTISVILKRRRIYTIDICVGGTDVDQRKRTVRQRFELLRFAQFPVSGLEVYGLSVRPSVPGRCGYVAAVFDAQYGRARREDTFHQSHGATVSKSVDGDQKRSE